MKLQREEKKATNIWSVFIPFRTTVKPQLINEYSKINVTRFALVQNACVVVIHKYFVKNFFATCWLLLASTSTLCLYTLLHTSVHHTWLREQWIRMYKWLNNTCIVHIDINVYFDYRRSFVCNMHGLSFLFQIGNKPRNESKPMKVKNFVQMIGFRFWFYFSVFLANGGVHSVLPETHKALVTGRIFENDFS